VRQDEERQDETETELKKVKVIIQEIDNKFGTRSEQGEGRHGQFTENN